MPGGHPFGVLDRNEHDGRAQKCTLCYDRQKDGMTPACAKACPTESIKFGELDVLKQEAKVRLEVLKSRGVSDAADHDPGARAGDAAAAESELRLASLRLRVGSKRRRLRREES